MSTNPYFTQYHTQRFSFIGSPQQRDGTYTHDQRFLNLYPELIKSPISDGKKYYLKKRPGVSSLYQFAAGNPRGIFYWAGIIWTAIGNTLYRGNTAVLTMTTTGGPVGFTDYRNTTNDVLFFCDGTHGWIIQTSGSSVQITDANFPSPHIPSPVFIDGYVFLAGSGQQNIYNSNLNDPTTWPVDGFIAAEMYPDNLVGLAKSLNYLVAVGQGSVEFMYDNANATGSPLLRNAPAVSQFGCPAFGTINQTESEVIMVGETGNGGRTIWVIQGFQPTEIANEPVREALDLEGTNMQYATANTIQCSGHKWYILNLYGASRTFVYDFEEQMWHEWSTGTTQEVFNWVYMTDTGLGYPCALHASSGEVATIQATQYTDDGNAINCVATTVKIDFDTEKRKRFYRLSLIGDAPNGDNTVGFTVQWSDDDYNTWSNPYTLNMNATYPTITQMGYSRRRAFQFTYQQPYPLRLEGFEVDIIQEVRR
jgi:hypothetical protein